MSTDSVAFTVADVFRFLREAGIDSDQDNRVTLTDILNSEVAPCGDV